MMLFKKTKHLLAALLCLCMVVAIVPAVAPEAAAADGDITYSFKGAWNQTLNATYANFATGRDWRFYAYASDAEWKNGSTVVTGDAIFPINGNLPIGIGPNYGVVAYLTSDAHWVALELNIPESGIYTLTGSGYKSYLGAQADFYLFKSPDASTAAEKEAAVKNALNNDNYLHREDYAVNRQANVDLNLNKEGILIPEAGKYVFVIRGTGVLKYPTVHTNGYYAYLYSLNLARTGDAPNTEPETPVVDEMSIDFGEVELVNGSFNPLSFGNCYRPGAAQAISNANGYAESFCATSNINSAYIAFDLGKIAGADLAEGTYDITLNYMQHPACATADVYLVPLTLTNNMYNELGNLPKNNSPIGRMTFYGQTEEKGHSVTFSSKALAEGNYILYIKFAANSIEPYSGRSYIFLEGIDIAPASGAAEAKDAIFGDSYAYVKNIDGTYTIDFIGAVKETEGYKKVGFEVWADGQYVGDAATSNVYNSITVNGEAKSAAVYGGNHVFVATKSEIAATATKIIVRPFVIDENDAKIYHGNKTFAVSLS